MVSHPPYKNILCQYLCRRLLGEENRAEGCYAASSQLLLHTRTAAKQGQNETVTSVVTR